MKKIIILFALFTLITSCDPSMTVEELIAKMKNKGETEEPIAAESNMSEEERSTSKNPMFNDLMMPQTGGVFRGVNFDDTRQMVYDLETKRSSISVYKDETDDELILTTDMGKEVLDFGDITYKFDEQGLYWIKVETYITTQEKADEVYEDIKAYFTKKLGEPTKDEEGYDVFIAKDRVSGYDYKVFLLNITDVEESYGMYMYFELQ